MLCNHSLILVSAWRSPWKHTLISGEKTSKIKLPTCSRSWIANRFLFFDFQLLTVHGSSKFKVFLSIAQTVRNHCLFGQIAVSPLSTTISHRDLPAAHTTVLYSPGIGPIVGDNSKRKDGIHPGNPDPDPGPYRAVQEFWLKAARQYGVTVMLVVL